MECAGVDRSIGIRQDLMVVRLAVELIGPSRACLLVEKKKEAEIYTERHATFCMEHRCSPKQNPQARFIQLRAPIGGEKKYGIRMVI